MEYTEKMEKKDEESSSEEDDIDAKETRCSPVKDYMIKQSSKLGSSSSSFEMPTVTAPVTI